MRTAGDSVTVGVVLASGAYAQEPEYIRRAVFDSLEQSLRVKFVCSEVAHDVYAPTG